MEEPKIFKDLNTYEKLNNIVSNSKPEKGNGLEYFLSKYDTLSIVRDFLSKNRDGSIHFLNHLERNKMINFNRKRMTYVDYSNGNINIHHQKDLEDSFALVNLIYQAYVKNYFLGDAVSNVEELRLYDHLNNTKLWEDALNQIKDNFYENNLLAENAESELELYKNYKKNNGIKYEDLSLKTLHYHANFKSYKSDLNIDNYGRCLLGYVLSTYIYERLNNKDLSIEDYNSLKRNVYKLNAITDKEIFKTLDLDIDVNEENGIYISDNSIKVLSKSYNNEVNKFNAR